MCYEGMEKKTAKKAAKALSEADFQNAYINHLLEHGTEPSSVFKFAKDLGTEEQDFYTHFNSFKVLERSIWEGWCKQTIADIRKDDAYMGYSVREKLLAFYYTWIQALGQNRSYALMRLGEIRHGDLNPYFLAGLKESFGDFINDLMMEGKDTSEVAERPFSMHYSKAFWLHFLFIQKFWLNDESKGFEKTDAAIEKSVNLAFDLVGKGALDSMLDFGKFLFQNRMTFA